MCKRFFSNKSAVRAFRRLLLTVGGAFVLSGCTTTERVELAPVYPVSGVRVRLDSFVNVHYGQGRSLLGWQTTHAAVETTLALWYDDFQTGRHIIDGTPHRLQTFLDTLPGPEDCDISVVYLGSNQNAAGCWEFVGGTHACWQHILRAAAPPDHPFRIVILDACYAAAIRAIPHWRDHFGEMTLLAAGDDEKTYQLLPAAKHPADIQRSRPYVWQWGQTHLPPDWRKHISFLGLIWIDAAAHTPHPPADKAQWLQFLQTCTQQSRLFRDTVNRRWGSTVQLY